MHQMAVECSAKPRWTLQQMAALQLNVRNLTKTLRGTIINYFEHFGLFRQQARLFG